jgi:hypothetical protein
MTLTFTPATPISISGSPSHGSRSANWWPITAANAQPSAISRLDARPGQRHQRHVALGLTQPVIVDRHRFGPTEDEAANNRHHCRHQHSANRIDMAQRVQAEPPQPLAVVSPQSSATQP